MRKLVVRAAIWAAMTVGIFAFAENNTKTLVTGGSPAVNTGSIGNPDDKVFDLPEDAKNLNSPEKPAYPYINGRPVADDNPLYKGKTEDILKECEPFKEAGKMEEFRKCFKEKRAQAVADVQSSFERKAKVTETPFRKTQGDSPVIVEQRKANAAFEAEENN